MADAKKAKDDESVAGRLTNVEAHPSQTDASKPALDPAKPDKG